MNDDTAVTRSMDWARVLIMVLLFVSLVITVLILNTQQIEDGEVRGVNTEEQKTAE